ncbi:MAG: hypothetical protein QW372_01075 [Nitrososphaerales archaeon]
MVIVLLDTSFILHMVSKPIVNFESLEEKLGKVEFVVLEDTIHELESLCHSKSVIKMRSAHSALNYAFRLMRVSIKGDESVDDKIVRFAIEKGAIVATLDAELKRKLKRHGVPVITLKNDKIDVNT